MCGRLFLINVNQIQQLKVNIYNILNSKQLTCLIVQKTREYEHIHA